ncbi:hypothetical protein DKP78_16675, partial [Enterococcus faecium]
PGPFADRTGAAGAAQQGAVVWVAGVVGCGLPQWSGGHTRRRGHAHRLAAVCAARGAGPALSAGAVSLRAAEGETRVARNDIDRLPLLEAVERMEQVFTGPLNPEREIELGL